MRVRSTVVAWMVGGMLASWATPAWGQNNFSTLTTGFNPSQAQAAPEPTSVDSDSGVAFIDSAAPHTTIRTRFDLAYRFRQPNRAEYFWAKGGPYNPGPLYPETKVDYQQLLTYGEFALLPYCSVFFESPYRWINPQVTSST